MTTYTIVDKDTDPLGPNEIAAGSHIEISDGDIFIVASSANADITFQAAGGAPADFEIRFEDSNSNDIKVKVEENLTPTVTIDSNTDLSDVDIDAKDADGLTLTAGDDVSLGKLEGSTNGDNTITIGDGFSTDQDWKLGNANDSLSAGDDATFKNLDAKDGDDTITLGDRANIKDFDAGKGDDVLSFGDDLVANKIKGGDGDDEVHIGLDATVNTVDGGKDTDTLYTATDGLSEKNFETRLLVCFAKGTRIQTPEGRVPVEELAVGQWVTTADHGARPLRWIGVTPVDGTALGERPGLGPVRIRASALGEGFPARDLLVSPQHRILIRSPIAQRMFGSAEVFIAAKKLTSLPGIKSIAPPGGVEYVHILFDRHEIVFAEGTPVKSLFLGPQVAMGLGDGAMREIRSALGASPGVWAEDRLARPCLRSRGDIAALLTRHAKNRKPLLAALHRADHAPVARRCEEGGQHFARSQDSSGAKPGQTPSGSPLGFCPV